MRRVPKGQPDAALYQVRKEVLSLIEQQSKAGHIDLWYGDESSVSEEGYVPYGWQFSDEKVCIEAKKGSRINCFALLSRDNQLFYSCSEQNITAAYVIEQLDKLSLIITKPTVVALDNARIHTAEKVKQCLEGWQNRGLFIFYLPPYSPHLNITERLWKELKSRWLRPEEYHTADSLFYAVHLALAAVGKELFIHFSDFNSS
ncbi:MAG: IS630 family transposase [Flavisolibacter sp.]|nr:IS630 family transposase [Flavisolibacter sp.]